MVEDVAGRHYVVIRRVLEEAGCPMGAEQIADVCGIDAYRVRKRLPEMSVEVEVAPGRRRTRSGRMERLWRMRSPK